MITNMGKIENNSEQAREPVQYLTKDSEQVMIFSNLGLGNVIPPTDKRETESAQLQRQNTKNTSSSLFPVESDQELHRGDTNSLLAHNLYYTTLLKAYVNDFQLNSSRKMENKQLLFKIAMGMLVSVPTVCFLLIIVSMICVACGTITVLESLPGILTALATILGTFMMIPKMITKYLFNKKEEKHLANIISKIQDYDKDIRGRL